MKELTWKPILSNLKEAFAELRRTHNILHFLTFGELPKDSLFAGDAEYLEGLRKRERRNPFGELSLFINLEHAYHHLNWAWNCRHVPEVSVWESSDEDAKAWTRFPLTEDFADLWPPDRSIKEDAGKLKGRIKCEPVRLALMMASRKLEILCCLVAKEIGGNWPRPKGLSPKVGKLPLSEEEFAGRMHRIYTDVNMAWNSRKDKIIVATKEAILRRTFFSSIFATGCYNMWEYNSLALPSHRRDGSEKG